MSHERRLGDILREEAAEVRERMGFSGVPVGEPLVFATEYAKYRERRFSWRTAEWATVTGTLSEQIDTGRLCRTISAVPAHVDDVNGPDDIVRHVETFCAAAEAHVVLLLNGLNSPETRARCGEVSARLRAKAHTAGVGDRLTVLAHLFATKPPIGTVRGILCDAILAHFARQSEALDPIIVTNDVDETIMSPDFASVLRSCFEVPTVDVASGPIYFGYRPDGIRFEPHLRLPELLLCSRLLDARRRCTRQGVISSQPYFTTEGPNSAFRAAAICAVGGYDYTRLVAEDDLLGTAVFSLRRAPGCVPYPHSEHVRWNEGLWVASSPRRILNAVCADVPMHEAWFHEPFSEVDGHSLDSRSLEPRYRSTSHLVQEEDVVRIEETRYRHKVRNRAVLLFERALTMTKLDAAEIPRFAEFYGLEQGKDGYVLSAPLLAALQESVAG